MSPLVEDWKRKRDARWRHNALMGSCRMAELFAIAVLNSSTCTKEAKEIAVRLEHDLTLMKEALKQRIDPK